jgi:DNA-binding MarR family transcriptional regulator
MNAHQNDVLTKADFERLSEFRYQLRRFLHVSESILRSENITPVQYLMLLHIKGMRGRRWATIAELAERLQTVHHGVVTLVSRCEAAAFVERRQSKADRRQVEVHLLPYGEQRLTRVAERHRGQLVPFSEAWRSQFDTTRADTESGADAGSLAAQCALQITQPVRKNLAGQRR